MTSDRRRQTGSLWWPLALSAFLSLPYLVAVRSFFVSDDWVYLRYYGPIPPWQVWRYFSPRVVWFYRPLQALQFGWLYHAAGLNPVGYNLSLWTMHVGVCLLVYVLASHLTTRRAALLAAVLFGSQWTYADVLLWSSNFSTLHWALVTLGLCILLMRYLECRRPALLVGVYALFLLNFCAKETAVNAPLLLAALWWWRSSKVESDSLEAQHGEAWRVLGPILLITAAYAALHHRIFHDVYQGPARPEYSFSAPGLALRHLLFDFNHLLIPVYLDPVLLPQAPLLQNAVRWFVLHALVLPPLLGVLAWRGRDRLLGLGLLWMGAALIPTVFLTGFHASRFYYLPAVGSSLIIARWGQWSWRRAARFRAWLRPLRPVLVGGLVYVLIANVSLVTLLCFRMRGEARWAASAFRVLRERPLPRASLIVMRHPPRTAFGNGIGVAEMVQIALGDPTAQGCVEGQKLPDVWDRRFQQMRAVYTLDFSQDPPALQCIRGAGRRTEQPGTIEYARQTTLVTAIR